MPQALNSTPLRLNSWKEIANYLGRGVRTVQRWEQELRMPVHRIGSGRRSPVYALPAEVNFWLSTSGIRPAQTRKEPTQMQPRTGRPVEESRRLLSDIHSLVRNVAEISVRQRRQAEILEKRIAEMRLRLGGGRK